MRYSIQDVMLLMMWEGLVEKYQHSNYIHTVRLLPSIHRIRVCTNYYLFCLTFNEWKWKKPTHRKFENHLTSWAVLFLLNLMSGKYILRTAEDGYRTQKNMSLAFLRCMGVRVAECGWVKEEVSVIGEGDETWLANLFTGASNTQKVKWERLTRK